MARYVALLRGINVGGVRVGMSDLRDEFAQLGFTDVRTVLATGNVVFDSGTDSEPSQLRALIEPALGTRFGYEAFVFVHTVDRVAAATAAYPFDERDGVHAYVVFVADDAVLTELLGVDIDGDVESVARGDGVVYWSVPQKQTLTSPFGKVLGNPKYKATTTNRNLRTLRKILG
ncbi:DUF1697 domain-containing protein [Williamsia sp. MIQD14]|uniref:DUF1697 domain-containing protein n=1 Tax=Williamsia sp. MIQD14 TaxID=3425703 RepID=UPI003DA07279